MAGDLDAPAAEPSGVGAAGGDGGAPAEAPTKPQRPANFWSAEDTTPSAIDEGLRRMLAQQHAHDTDLVPARVLNLIAVVDKEWRGEVENRLDNVGRYHPSRTIICAVDPRQTELDAWATMMVQDVTSGLTLCHEQIELTVGPKHLPHLDTICDPLVVSDIPTVVWSPHGHEEAVDSLVKIAQVVLTDSVEAPDEREAVLRALDLKEQGAYVVDLAWLRSTPWRERLASTFDPPKARPALAEIDAVTVRHHAASSVAALLYVGWLASRLGWEPSALASHNGVQHGKLHTRRHDIAVKLETVNMRVPGLAGVTVKTASGLELSLDRGPGGLTLKRRRRNGSEQQWTVMGASRGEAGILGEGVRQALLRDPTYSPALRAARAMLS
jgi:glucose-6-phosphate dehydrogenase assembly protein OpcA